MRPSAYPTWDAFLASTQGTFDQLMWDGRVTCLGLLDLRALDSRAMAKAWLTVRAEVFSLVERIGQTYRRQLGPALEVQGAPGSALVEHAAHGRRVGQKMLHDLERMEIEVFGEAAEKLLGAARSGIGATLRCRHCRASMAPPPALFRSVEVGCPSCGQANTYAPTPAVRNLEPFCTHHLSQREAIGEWEALVSIERRRKEPRGSSRELLQTIEAATLRYWEAYFGARARLLPAPRADVERDIASLMRPIREELDHLRVV